VRFFLIGVLLLAVYYLSDVFLLLVASVVLASAIEPVIRRLGRYKINRVLAVIFIYLIIALFLGMVLVFFMPAVVNDLMAFLSNLPQTFSLSELWLRSSRPACTLARPPSPPAQSHYRTS